MRQWFRRWIHHHCPECKARREMPMCGCGILVPFASRGYHEQGSMWHDGNPKCNIEPLNLGPWRR